MDNSKLQARVEGINKCHAYANGLYERLIEIFRPLVGCKIEKADGTLLKKIADQLPQLGNKTFHVYKIASNYSLVWNVKICIQYPGEGHCTYHDVSVYIANVRDGVITELLGPPKFRTDFTVEGVVEARETYEAAETAYRAAQSALFPFGEYDR